MTRRLLEVETLAAFDRHIGRARKLNGWLVQSLDLTDRSDALLTVDARGGVFLGCRFDPAVEHRLRAAGALVFPRCRTCPSTRTGRGCTTLPSCTGPVRLAPARMR